MHDTIDAIYLGWLSSWSRRPSVSASALVWATLHYEMAWPTAWWNSFTKQTVGPAWHPFWCLPAFLTKTLKEAYVLMTLLSGKAIKKLTSWLCWQLILHLIVLSAFLVCFSCDICAAGSFSKRAALWKLDSCARHPLTHPVWSVLVTGKPQKSCSPRLWPCNLSSQAPLVLTICCGWCNYPAKTKTKDIRVACVTFCQGQTALIRSANIIYSHAMAARQLRSGFLYVWQHGGSQQLSSAPGVWASQLACNGRSAAHAQVPGPRHFSILSTPQVTTV